MAHPMDRLVLPLVALLACGPVREELTLDQICVMANGDGALVADQPMRVTIGVSSLRTCRRPCDTLVASACSVRREGRTLHLQGHITVDVDCPSGDLVTTCSEPIVECTAEPLPEGDYVLTDGTRELRFHVPSALPRYASCSY